ncbi:gp26 [Burkholderia pseudomallei]|nr:gp26 [Burkholderia pseudomallei]CAJ7396947.1 gp26 [Burkholderia pseudomallei]
MANLKEQAQWEDGVYQLETSDPVIGGPDGIDNLQAKQLANRTKYLKQQQESHASAVDPHPQYATKTDLSQRLADLVGQSPSTLDTLNELAKALGNDPNFATTMTNALSQKAPLDSPTFTGAPKGTTPAPLDSSTRMATTEFVRRALGNVNFASYISSQKLTASQAGSCINFWGGAAATFALPAVSTMPLGGTFLFNNSSDAPLTIVRDGNDSILLNGGNPSATLTLGDSLLLVAVPPGQWIAAGGSAQLPFSSVMAGPNWSTASQFDNSARLATTAFVQRALGSFSGAVDAESAITLKAGQAGMVVYSTKSPTVTLPLVSTVPEGAAFFIAAAGTIVTQGSDVIYNASGSAVGASYVTGPTPTSTAPALVVRNGGVWQILMGSSALKGDNLFAATLAIPGFSKFPNGLILQWGSFMSSGTGNPNATVTFPIAFPNACLGLSPTIGGGSIGNFTVQTYAAFKTGATLSCQNNAGMSGGVGGNYFAIGF